MAVDLLPKQFLGCLPLRIGTYTAAGFTIVMGLASAIITAFQISAILDNVKIKEEKEPDQINQMELAVAKGCFIITLIIECLWAFSGFLLLLGVIKNKRPLITTWLVFNFVFLGITFLGALSLASGSNKFEDIIGKTSALEIIVSILILFLLFYLVLVVSSFYKEIKTSGLPPSYTDTMVSGEQFLVKFHDPNASY